MAMEWISTEESAKEMLERSVTERPPLLIPPLQRLPLRSGNVVEIVGPSPSAKTHILIQAAIKCILPKEWRGIYYGGMERLVMFIDLDCRFDVHYLSKCLMHRISTNHGVQDRCNSYYFDEDLHSACMKRFLYARCYNSLEFLALLKNVGHQMKKEGQAHGVGVHLLMLDSIGAFYWIDKASKPLPTTYSRPSLSFQRVMETVVQELRKLLHARPIVILATKASIFGPAASSRQKPRSFPTNGSTSSTDFVTEDSALYREYMPPAWKSLVTHKIILQVSDDSSADAEGNSAVYISRWVLPALKQVDKFIVRDEGIFLVA